ncbi:hypothetical protein SGRIM128S_07270 [Streptomyces griseomycini]
MAPAPPTLAITVDGTEQVVGHAGELHPGVLKTLGLPARTCAMELDLDALEQVGDDTPQAPGISTFPVATQDVALVVDAFVPAADVEDALREGAGELLESIRLFDVYENAEQLGEGRKSLAYALRFRAGDRTLTVDEASAARESVVALRASAPGPSCGASHRGAVPSGYGPKCGQAAGRTARKRAAALYEGEPTARSASFEAIQSTGRKPSATVRAPCGFEHSVHTPCERAATTLTAPIPRGPECSPTLCSTRSWTRPESRTRVWPRTSTRPDGRADCR